MRRCSLRVRTTPALTTVPFLVCPSGEASLTAAVITSPRWARRPVPPPRGRIICSLRAPELSATSSIDLIITDINLTPRFARGFAAPRYGLQAPQTFALLAKDHSL